MLVVAIVALSLWTCLLTVLVTLCVRQITLLSLRLSRASGLSLLDRDGPEVGDELPADVVAALPGALTGHVTFLLVSATCNPCRQLAVQLTAQDLKLDGLVAFIAGRDELAEELLQLLPPGLRVVREPTATALAKALSIKSTPFGVSAEDGRVVAKSYIHKVDDLQQLVDERLLPRRQGV